VGDPPKLLESLTACSYERTLHLVNASKAYTPRYRFELARTFFNSRLSCFYVTVKVRFGLDSPIRIPLTVNNPGIDITVG